MNTLKKLSTCVAVATAVMFVGAEARAAWCDQWEIGHLNPTTYTGGGILVFGEEVDSSGNGTGHLAVCENDTVAYNYARMDGSASGMAGCTSSSTDKFLIFGTPVYGDYIAPVVELTECGTGTGNWLKPFAPTFSFGIYAVGNGGPDKIYGTENDDEIYSRWEGDPSGDSAVDVLCGYGGDDLLVGDDDGAISTVFECIDGGSGNDTCDSRTLVTAANDRKVSCETTGGNWSSLAWSTPICGAACGTSPPVIIP